MKTPVLLTVLLLSLHIATAQVATSTLPPSFSLTGNTLFSPVEYTLPPFDLSQAEWLDKEDTKNDRVPKFARSVYTNFTLDNSGKWAELDNGDRLWQIQVKSAGAQALIPYFNSFYLPQGATLHVYSTGTDEVLGAFTSVNNPASGYYTTGLIHGESCVLEYFEPKEVRGQGKLSLNEVGHAYRWVSDYMPVTNGSRGLGFRQSGNCQVNANCPEGTNWQNQKKSVACIIGKHNSAEFYCSGALINNVKEDCTPYFLSAQHCVTTTTEQEFAQWLFYFNYESSDCNTPFNVGTLGNQFITGCTKKSDSNDNGGTSGSDFSLLQLSQQPPGSFGVYYAGWKNSNAIPASGVCIHHPKGDIKKISTYTVAAVSSNYGSAAGSHWKLRWATTTTSKGVTEPGSSGSPLFDEQGFIIGQLSGGNSACGAATDTVPDYFGKVAYNWTSNGLTANRQLKPWLDPDNTGISSLQGKSADCAVGISEVPVKSISLSVTPNPSEGIFRLGFTDNSEKKIQVFDATGKLVHATKADSKDLTLDLSLYARGIYTLIAETTSGRAVQKIVLQ